MSLLKYFHPGKRTRDDPSGPLYSKISLSIIKAANVEVHAVHESQDTPSRSPYHVSFAMLVRILQLPKMADSCLYHLQCMCKCTCIPALKFSCYVAIDIYTV